MLCNSSSLQMTSVERILEYTEIESEAETHKDDYIPPNGWPSSGNLQFQDMCLSYGKDAGNVLKNITLSICDKEKVSLHVFAG